MSVSNLKIKVWEEILLTIKIVASYIHLSLLDIIGRVVN